MAILKKYNFFFWILAIIFLSFASFWRVFSFGLWKDDWALIWASLSNTYYYHGYFNHPGTPLEFFLLSKLFGTQAFFWQSFGFLLHIFVSLLVGIFLEKLTNSKKVGMLSGIFFAATPIGLETIYFPSTQVIALAAIPFLLGLIYFLQLLSNSTRKNLFASLFFFLLALFLDPPRILPIIFLLPLVLFLKPQTKTIQTYKKFFLFFYPIIFIFLAVAISWWFTRYSLDTLIGKIIARHALTLGFIFSKLHDFGHFFATIANLCIGLMYSIQQDNQNVAQYSRFFGYFGFAIFLLTLFLCFIWIKSKKYFAGLTIFFLGWMFLFYFPNWVSEPRAPMALAHRYVFLSGIGFIGLVAYFVAKIQNKLLYFFAVLFFLFLNIYQANRLLFLQSTYRNNTVIANMWEKVNADVATNDKNSIFMFFGKEPYLTQDIYLSGAMPFAYLRKDFTDPTQMPILTQNATQVLLYLCQPNQKIINLYFVAYEKKKISLHHVYAWHIANGGTLINISQKERKILQGLAAKTDCKINL